ncbi:MAG: hypothetical protein ABIP53_12200, partial [Candidatus Limnocylindrales bacterium]
DALSAVGDMGSRILAALPAQVRPLVGPYIGNIVLGIHEAFSLAIANTMWLSVVATAVAVLTTITLREVPLRTTHHAESPVARRAPTAELPAAE